MNIQNTLIQNLITVRRHRGLTQSELGKQIGYSDKTISKWENGDSCPSIEALYQLSRFYGVSIDDLLSESFQIQEEGEAVADLSDEPQSPRPYHRVIMALLLPLAVYTVAVLVFAILSLCGVPNPWLAFIDAIPVAVLSLFLLGRKWNIKLMAYIAGSGIMWSVILAVYLHLLSFNIWVLFLPPIPVQAAIVLLAVLKKKSA